MFAIVNAVPAIGLLYYGFFNKGLVPGLCFGAVSPYLCFDNIQNSITRINIKRTKKCERSNIAL